MYKRLILSVFFVLFSLIYASGNGGRDLRYATLDYTADENFDPELYIEDLSVYLSSYSYSVGINSYNPVTIKYDGEKYWRFTNDICVKKQEMDVRLNVVIEQRQPYLSYRKKKNDYSIHFNFIVFPWGNDQTEEVFFFRNELYEIIKSFHESRLIPIDQS